MTFEEWWESLTGNNPARNGQKVVARRAWDASLAAERERVRVGLIEVGSLPYEGIHQHFTNFGKVIAGEPVTQLQVKQGD